MECYISHYSKSQIFVQKFNFDKTPTFSRVFHPNFFWQFFSWNQSCQQLKGPKPQHFHEFFTQKNRQFSRKIKVECLEKKWRCWTFPTLHFYFTSGFVVLHWLLGLPSICWLLEWWKTTSWRFNRPWPRNKRRMQK